MTNSQVRLRPRGGEEAPAFQTGFSCHIHTCTTPNGFIAQSFYSPRGGKQNSAPQSFYKKRQQNSLKSWPHFPACAPNHTGPHRMHLGCISCIAALGPAGGTPSQGIPTSAVSHPRQMAAWYLSAFWRKAVFLFLVRNS